MPDPLWKVDKRRDGFHILSPAGLEEAFCITLDDVMAWVNAWEERNDVPMSFELNT